MVQGCTSWAGKSWLATALCRWYARQGLRVAPFKAQNMANNARVVGPGPEDRWPSGEIGVAQWLQARAAGMVPDVRVNPVLVKPESWTSSQVVVNGRVSASVSALPWEERGPVVAEAMHAAYVSLAAEYDLIVLEGAGSPAEVNLDDRVNMAMAAHADAPVLLVADIDRGGAFAHLYGTWSLVGAEDRDRIRGFVLNRFRGDPALLAPGPDRLEELTGVPTVGVVPMVEHGLPDEDGADLHRRVSTGPVVGIVRYPTASNLDEYARLAEVARVRWVGVPGDLDGLDSLVLPGSKHVLGDLAWLRRVGLDAAVVSFAAGGGRVLGICGGMMLLGRSIEDPLGVDGRVPGVVESGLGLLDVVTTFAPDKVVGPVAVSLGSFDGVWSSVSGASFDGYEIRHGRLTGAVDDSSGTVVASSGPVLGVLAHGMLEDDGVLRALTGTVPTTDLEAEFDHLADLVDKHLDTDLLRSLAGR